MLVLGETGLGTNGMMIKNLEDGENTKERGVRSSQADPPLSCLASSGEVKGITGKYFIKKRMKPAAKKCSDIKLQKELWQLSERLTGIDK